MCGIFLLPKKHTSCMLKRLGRRMGLERGSIGFGEKGFVYKGFFHSRKPGIGLTNTALEIPRDAKAFWKINEKGNMKVAFDQGNYSEFKGQKEDIISLMKRIVKLARVRGARRIRFEQLEMSESHLKGAFPKIEMSHTHPDREIGGGKIGIAHGLIGTHVADYEHAPVQRPAYTYDLILRNSRK